MFPEMGFSSIIFMHKTFMLDAVEQRFRINFAAKITQIVVLIFNFPPRFFFLCYDHFPYIAVLVMKFY